MRGVILLLAAALAPVPAAAAAGPPPVLGIDWSVPGQRLAWYDPQTLRMLPGRKAPLAFHISSGSFSADRSVLALGGNGATLRLVDARRMRVVGDLRLAPGGDSIGGVTWLRPDRLLAYVRRPGATSVVAVDPVGRRVLRRVVLEGIDAGLGRLPDGLALLLRPEDGVGPARVAVADEDGRVRTATVGRIAIGSARQVGSGEIVESRSAGFAVDPDGRTAYVVGAEALAQVDLDTLAVAYPSSPRELAKAIAGPARTAAWLGGGVLAVSGADYATAKAADGTFSTSVTPYGLRLLDLAAGTVRTVDPHATWLELAQGLVLAHDGDEVLAYGPAGARRSRLTLADGTWLNTTGARGLVCSQRNLVAVVDLATGARTAAARGRTCPDLLSSRSFGY